MNKQFKVERDILFYALRYALGRQTFAPTVVIENIKENIDLFDTNDFKIIIREILQQDTDRLGMECDIDKWMGFIKYLKERI